MRGARDGARRGADARRRIAQGPIPLDEALAIARQIAEALEAAHEKGIVHRDLKPANIKVTRGRPVKVLDFGLAKGRLERRAGADLSHRRRSGDRRHGAGVILGTAAYMSPEQARGQSVDKRTDIWASAACCSRCSRAGGRSPVTTVTDSSRRS